MSGRRILLCTLGSFGDLDPYLGLALALRARGHAPVIATSPFYREHVERAGIPFHPVRPDVDPNDRALVSRIMEPVRGTEFLLRECVLPSLGDAWEDLSHAVRGVDLVMSHPITFAAPIVADEHGVPWVSGVLAPMSFFSPHDLPVFPPFPALKRLERVPGIARLLVGAARATTGRWTAPVRALRAARGLPPAGDPLYEGQHSPRLVLALFSRVLAAPQPDWPPNVRVTGAIAYHGPAGAATMPPELTAFLDAGPPPLVFTLGSSAVSAAGDFYVASAAAARALGRRAVLLTGRHPENRVGIPAGDDLLVLDWAPHRALLPRAAAVVHQGGIGTLHEALRAGRPQLVVPWAHDQPDNAHRAARLGVARVLSPRRYRAARAAESLRALLADTSVAAHAEAVARTVRAEDGAAAACDAIERVLAGGVADDARTA